MVGLAVTAGHRRPLRFGLRRPVENNGLRAFPFLPIRQNTIAITGHAAHPPKACRTQLVRATADEHLAPLLTFGTENLEAIS